MSENWLNFAPSCERNKVIILEQLQLLVDGVNSVLEIGSYSGQHACYFTKHFPKIIWQCSDRAENIAPLIKNLMIHGGENLPLPVPLDVSNKHEWPNHKVDLIYSANTLHIMSWPHVVQLFDNIIQVAKAGTLLVVYGPFNFDGHYTSESNAEFDIWLKERDELSAIRDFELVDELAKQAGFSFVKKVDMPANNQLLVWQI